VVLAASARAIAASARRTGLRVFAADLFGDRDLTSACEAHRVVREYPQGLADAAASFPQAPWIYGGAIELHEELIAEVSRRRPLAGCPPYAVRMVRNPDWLAEASHGSGLEYPETVRSPDGVPTDGSFFLKPRKGAGGRGIAPWTAEAARADRDRAAWIWQRRIEGIPRSVTLLLGPSAWVLVGFSEQLVGLPASRGPRFGWCGGVEAEPVASDRFGHLARRLAEVGCRGLVGIDFIEDGGGNCHVLEVNPRPTASMELFERGGRGSLIAAHLEACGFTLPSYGLSPFQPPRAELPRRCWAKGLLFAARDVAVTSEAIQAWSHLDHAWRRAEGDWPALADLPRPETVVSARGPVLTVFASGRNATAARRLLEERLRSVEQTLVDAAPASPRAAPPE
jgi:predicted ATP-grasp superfamily ATP-dependent carboligase